MRDENLNLMNQRRNQQEMERANELGTNATVASPHAIGDGYKQQLANMQEQERQKAVKMHNYASNVGSPARQKQLQD